MNGECRLVAAIDDGERARGKRSMRLRVVTAGFCTLGRLEWLWEFPLSFKMVPEDFTFVLHSHQA